MTATETKPVLRGFLKSSLNCHLEDGDDMFGLGYASSMFAMQLVDFVEGSFGIKVGSDDLDVDNFRSIDAVAAFVERKTAGLNAA